MSSVALTVRDYHKDIPGKLSDDKFSWEFPLIKTKNNRTGKTLYWRIVVRIVDRETNTRFIKIRDEYFDSGKQLPDKYVGWIKVFRKQIDSKSYAKVAPTIVTEGKNIGDKDETNIFTQALRDALSKHNLQLKKSVDGTARDKYETTDKPTPRYPPMLLQVYAPGEDELDFKAGVWVQRKYDGVHVVLTLEPIKEGWRVLMYSRNKNEYLGIKHIKDEIMPTLLSYWKDGRKLYLDGEIYRHGWKLQKISGLARRELTSELDSKDVMELTLKLFDCFIPEEPNLMYNQRKALLDGIFDKEFKYVFNVETYPVKSDKEIADYYKQFLKEGFEGAIIRKGDRTYQYSYNNFHSANVLKWKQTMDGEYKISKFTEGRKGKAKGQIMLILETPEGKEFPVTPALSEKERRELFKKMSIVEKNNKTHFENHYKGKMLTITFEDLSEDKIPLRARTTIGGLIIRDYE